MPLGFFPMQLLTAISEDETSVDSLSSLAPPRLCLRFQEIGQRSGGSAFSRCSQMKETTDPPGRISIDGPIDSYGLRDDSFNDFQTGTKYLAANREFGDHSKVS